MPATASFTGSAPLYNPQQQLAAGQAVRKRLLEASISPEEARGLGYKSISQGWAVRRYDQCFELDGAVRDMGTADFRLVLKDGRISIWRKK